MGYCVYKHTAPNGKIYIGVTGRDPEKRWGNNGSGYRTQVFYRAIQKYGWYNIKHEILFTNLSKDEASALERKLIDAYKSDNPNFGYNMESGGLAGKTVSLDSRKKMSKSAAGRVSPMLGKKHTKEALEKMSKNRSGISAWNKGKTGIYSEYSLYLMSKNAKRWNAGKHLSEETKAKIGIGNKGKIHSNEQNEYMRKLLTGRKSSDEAIFNRAKGHMIKVVCVETEIVYESLKDAQIQTGIDKSSITKVCKGKRDTAGGLHWKYLEVNNEYI